MLAKMTELPRILLPQSPALEVALTVVAKLREHGHSALLVGGCVRDMLLHLPPKDFDIATSAHPPQVRALFAHVVEVGAAFGVLRVQQRDRVGKLHDLEVATFRAESGYRDGRRPDDVRFTDAREDVLRRDFTINGLLCDPLDVVQGHAVIQDWVGGLADLETRQLRAIGDPQERFGEDALRLLRAPRFAARFGLTVETQTRLAIQQLAPQLTRVSAERIREELNGMLTAPTAPLALHHLRDLRLDVVLWPELANLPDSAHAAGMRLHRAREALADVHAQRPDAHPLDTTLDFPLALALTLHPVRAHWPMERLTARLRLARSEWRRILQIWHLADALTEPLQQRREIQKSAALIKLLRHADADAALLLLHALDPQGQALEWREIRAQTLRIQWSPELFVTGDTLTALGHRPGPRFRQALEVAEDAQLLGKNPQESLEIALAVLHNP